MLVRLVVAEGEAPPAIAHARQLGLAADVIEALDAQPVGVLREPQAVLEEVVVLQRHGALGVKDKAHRPVRALDPTAQLVRVADRRREADEDDVRGRVDDRLFPDRATLLVADEVHLVEDDAAHARELLVQPRAPRQLRDI